MGEARKRQAERRRCRPFIKWVGGKSQLLPEILARLPERFETYHEPFLGGGALFFALQPDSSILSDINPELINTYRVVRDSVHSLIDDLKRHHYQEEYYYTVRNIDRSETFQKWTDVQRASRFIYLNKTCFNGLYRVNSKGHHNVPFGRYSNPTICDEESLLACSIALSNTNISVAPIGSLLDRARRGDFVYFDPPYAPLTTTSNFTNYAESGFGSSDQEALRDLCIELDKRGVKFLLSNSSAPLILELYSEFELEFVQATRAVNSNAKKRGKIDEVLVRNYH